MNSFGKRRRNLAEHGFYALTRARNQVLLPRLMLSLGEGEAVYRVLRDVQPLYGLSDVKERAGQQLKDSMNSSVKPTLPKHVWQQARSEGSLSKANICKVLYQHDKELFNSYNALSMTSNLS